MLRIPSMQPALFLGVVCWLAFVLPEDRLSADTIINGGNIINQTWTTTGSPYIVQGDVTIPSGAFLTINAGVTVRFTSTDGLATGVDTSRVELTVKGTLSVNGTSANPVTFEAQSGTAAGTWYGILVNATASNASLSYAVIRHAFYGIRNDAPGTVLQLTQPTVHLSTYGLSLNAGNVTLSSVRLFNNSYGLYVGPSVSLTLNASRIYSNSIYGIWVQNATSPSITLSNSLIYSNTSHGIAIQQTTTDSPTIRMVNCTIHGNGSRGVDVFASGITVPVVNVTNCIVSSNLTGVQRSGTAVASITYSDVWNNSSGNYSSVAAGTGCISVNPLYLDADGADNLAGTADDDFHLASNSPCIDAGLNAAAVGSGDFAGNPRFVARRGGTISASFSGDSACTSPCRICSTTLCKRPHRGSPVGERSA